MLKSIYFVKILAFSLFELSFCKILHYQPEQIHLAFGEQLHQIVVTWSTRDKTEQSIVEYGHEGLLNSSKGESKLFIDNGPDKKQQYIHKVILSNLRPETKYIYHCGSDLGWSALFWFKTPSGSNTWSPNIVLYGDMGNVNPQSLPRLQEETQREMYDAIIHIGDFAYDFHNENGKVGDEFMNQIQSIAAYLPYMVCPGNHESAYNFSHYRARFNMPGGAENLMYSFNLGPVHFISFSTEVYYFLQYGMKLLTEQYNWLEKDLIEATKPENRLLRPWIVTYGHRPMYCSNDNRDDCTNHESVVRVGLPLFDLFGLENLFYKYNVDIEFWAHEHSYERLWPIYNFVVYNGSHEHPYTNPGAPIHIITGSAGCVEGTDPFPTKTSSWSAFHSRDFGYTRMKPYNSTHIYFEQVSDNKNGEIIDSFWVIKTKNLLLRKYKGT